MNSDVGLLHSFFDFSITKTQNVFMNTTRMESIISILTTPLSAESIV